MTRAVNRWKEVKLTAHARQVIREAIRRHPSATQHVKSSTEISKLPKTALLELATKLGIDVLEKIKATDYDFSNLNAVAYPFHGTVEFDVTFKLLGLEVVRKARIHYDHSPAWSFFDVESGGERIGSESSSFTLEVQAEHAPTTLTDITENGRTVWKQVPTKWEKCNDLTEMGILSDEMMEAIFELIDRDCREQDSARRKLAGT